MESLTLVAGLLLPWLVGVTVLVAGLRGRRALDDPGELAFIAGAGYLVGALLLTLWMRLLATAGIGFGATAIAAPLLVATAAIGYYVHRREGAALTHAVRAALPALGSPPGLDRAARIAWRLLLAWILVRFALLGLEVHWRPLFPWDAWTQWATKARVWYELGRIAPFAGADAWIAADGASYFDAAPGYPPTLPLLQVWACIALGRWDDSLMNWPWWQIAASLALCVYGALRGSGLTALAALVATFFVASIPLADVHVALAGYGDLPMAAYYTCAVLAFLRWSATRDGREAALVAVLAIGCIEIKRPGLAWALTLVPGAVVVLLPRQGIRIAAAGVGVLLFVLAVLAQTRPVIFGYPLHLDFEPSWPAIGDSYFLLGNWNLLWYGALAAALLAWRRIASPALAPLTMVVAAAGVVLLVVIGLPDPRAWLGEWTSVNRATLQLAPLIAVYMSLAFHEFAVGLTGNVAATQTAGT